LSSIATLELRLQQFKHLVRQIPMMTLVSVINTLIVVFVLAGFAPNLPMIAWASAIILPNLYNLWRALRYRRKAKAEPSSVSPESMRRAMVWTGYMGLVWGLAGPLFILGAPVAEAFFVVFVVGGMFGGLVATLYPLPAQVYSFGALAAPPIIASLLLNGSRIEFGMAVLFIIFSGGLGGAAWMGYWRFCDLVTVKRDLTTATDLLADAVESTSEAFAVFDHAGHPLFTNREFQQLFPQGAPTFDKYDQGSVFQIEDGRWLKHTRRPTASGGWVSIYTDITALKQQELELETARNTAEAANKAKTQFLAVMSHELRTPLNSVIGFSELLQQPHTELPPETVRDYAHQISVSGRHLLSLISDILNLSRIEEGRYELHEDNVAITDIVREAIATIEPQASAADVKTDLDLGYDGAFWGDARALRQIVDNLLSNAVKFTAQGNHVLVRIETAEDRLELVVEDQGIGIPEEALDTIFEPFHQIDSSFSRKEEGTGLGLPLVRRLAELHGGSVSVNSQLGSGSRFVVNFPRARCISPA